MVTPPSDRFALIKLLNEITSQDLDMLLFAVDAPSNVIPPNNAPQSDRVAALLRWAEASTGCGLRVLQQELAKIVPLPQNDEIATAQLWNIPYPRNPFFTARETVLQELREALLTNKLAALSGLGGIGKTQTAIEYAYRYKDEYQQILWVRAASQQELVSGLVKLAELLKLPVSQEKDESLVIAALKQWLATHHGWLLILDNADEIPMLREFLPGTHQGHVLLTTRAQATGIYQRIEIKKLQPEDGALLLLRRAKLIAENAGLDAATEEERSLAETISREMDGLPLALDQAAAFIEETPSSLAEYLQLYREEGARLLAERGELTIDHPSVSITFSLAFEKVMQRNPTAADLIRVCAFLAPDAIPEEIFTGGAAELGENLSQLANKPLDFVKVIAKAGRFSLIYRNSSNKTLDIHRLVQEVLKAEMDEDNRRLWAERTVCAVTKVFPDAEFANWRVCERLLPHARVAINWISQYQFELETAALLLNKTGYYLQERGQYSEAEPLYQKALPLRQRLLGEEHPDVATSYNNLAFLYYFQGRYSEAEPLYQKALSLRQRLLGEEHLDVATSYNNLAFLYNSQGRYSEAEPLYQAALSLRQRLLGEVHPDAATSYNNLAVFYHYQGRYSEAEPLYQTALSLRQRLLGEEHPYVATSYNNLAGLYSSQGRYSEAEPLYHKALLLYQRLLGEEHPDVATSYNNLAGLYSSQGRYSEAEPLYHKALLLYQRLLGEEHPHVATSYNDLANLYNSQGRYSEAEPLYQTALSLRQRLLGEEHPHVATSYNDLANLYNSQGRYSEAELLYQTALSLYQRLLGEVHPHVATSYYNLAALYYSQGRYSEVEPLFQKALEIADRTLGVNHPNTIMFRNNLQLLRERG